MLDNSTLCFLKLSICLCGLAKIYIGQNRTNKQLHQLQVRLTSTPEYFDFWQGKPLRERDFGVKMHKRKSWQRPKSDYGTRSLNRNSKNKENGNGEGGEGDGVGGLETLLERDGDSSLSSRRGSRDVGRMGDMDKNKSGLQDDSSKLSISGEGLDSRRGSKDLGGKDKNKT